MATRLSPLQELLGRYLQQVRWWSQDTTTQALVSCAVCGDWKDFDLPRLFVGSPLTILTAKSARRAGRSIAQFGPAGSPRVCAGE